jgi:DNA polymerase III alpha subunit
MRTDKFGNIVYNETDLLELVYQNKTNMIEQVICEPNLHIKGFNLKSFNENLYEMSIKDFDHICQNEWLIPEEYREFDIVTWLFNQIPPWDDGNDRLFEELKEFESRNMIPLLRWLKYFVDTCRKNDVVWGVGRGSSVSSYVLYLIGVHKIDPLKYNLDWKDFLR